MADNISFTMFQSFRFKILAGYAYIYNIERYLEAHSEGSDSRFAHLSVQILTVPQLSLDILKQNSLRERIWNCFKKYSKIDSNSPSHYRR